MDQLTKAQRRETAERLTALLDMIAAGAIEATALETAYLSGAVQGLDARPQLWAAANSAL